MKIACDFWKRQEYRDTYRLLPAKEDHKKQVLRADQKEDDRDPPCGSCQICDEIARHAVNQNVH